MHVHVPDEVCAEGGRCSLFVHVRGICAEVNSCALCVDNGAKMSFEGGS